MSQMLDCIIRNANIVNRGEITEGDVGIKKGRIIHTGSSLDEHAKEEVDAKGKYLIPGLIDDQVHFREPGYTHKATISTESRAAVAGGVTSFMEMPNTKPPAVTQDRLEDKYAIAKSCSPANYSFFMGCTNDNLEEVLKTDPRVVCGLKIFMGSSTGDMLVDDAEMLEHVFSQCPLLIATHCEDEDTVRSNAAMIRDRYGDDVDASIHPKVRTEEACWLSSSKAVELAKKHGARLHILHLSTAREMELFEKGDPGDKKITAEACVHHLTFDDSDYPGLGNRIKCNPAIKTAEDREALWHALLEDRLDVIATDHAPHSQQEKEQGYWDAPSGLPLVQHSLPLMLDHVHAGRISMEDVVRKMCHAPADCFDVKDRGYIDEGMHADLVLVDPEKEWKVTKEYILYKCGWSPLEGRNLTGAVSTTWVNGEKVYEDGDVLDVLPGQRLLFDRN